MIKELFGAIASPVTGWLGKREDRKVAVEQVKGAVALAKQQGDHEVRLSDKQWELVSKQLEAGSWKDEYITIVVTSPLVCILAGSMYAAFTDDQVVLTGVTIAISQLQTIGIDLGELMFYTVLAALGIKAIK